MPRFKDPISFLELPWGLKAKNGKVLPFIKLQMVNGEMVVGAIHTFHPQYLVMQDMMLLEYDPLCHETASMFNRIERSIFASQIESDELEPSFSEKEDPPFLDDNDGEIENDMMSEGEEGEQEIEFVAEISIAPYRNKDIFRSLTRGEIPQNKLVVVNRSTIASYTDPNTTEILFWLWCYNTLPPKRMDTAAILGKYIVEYGCVIDTSILIEASEAFDRMIAQELEKKNGINKKSTNNNNNNSRSTNMSDEDIAKLKEYGKTRWNKTPINPN